MKRTEELPKGSSSDELLPGDILIAQELYDPHNSKGFTLIWDSRNLKAVEKELYLKRILPIKRKMKIKKIKNKLKEI
jgi:hypothetical protein